MTTKTCHSGRRRKRLLQTECGLHASSRYWGFRPEADIKPLRKSESFPISDRRQLLLKRPRFSPGFHDFRASGMPSTRSSRINSCGCIPLTFSERIEVSSEIFSFTKANTAIKRTRYAIIQSLKKVPTIWDAIEIPQNSNSPTGSIIASMRIRISSK